MKCPYCEADVEPVKFGDAEFPGCDNPGCIVADRDALRSERAQAMEMMRDMRAMLDQLHSNLEQIHVNLTGVAPAGFSPS